MNTNTTSQAPQTCRSGLRDLTLDTAPSASNLEIKQTSTGQTVNANTLSAKQMLASLLARRQRLYDSARVDSYEFTGIAG